MIAVELDQPGRGPAAPQPPVRWIRRVLAGYSVTLIAIGAGAVPVFAGLTVADRCTRPGFGCLDYGLAGWAAGLLLGALLLLVLTLAFRLGPLFWPAALVLLVGPTVLSDGAAAALAVPVAGPALAVWAAAPSTPAPPRSSSPTGGPRPGSGQSRLGPAGNRVLRIAVVLIVGLLLPVLVRRLG